MTIVHILKEQEWARAKERGFYGEEYLKTCGFIHCSSIKYVLLVANYLFVGMTDLLLLCIDTEKVQAEIKWEDSDGTGRCYPHIYGVLNLDAVIDIFKFPPGTDGSFSLPPGIEKYY